MQVSAVLGGEDDELQAEGSFALSDSELGSPERSWRGQ